MQLSSKLILLCMFRFLVFGPHLGCVSGSLLIGLGTIQLAGIEPRLFGAEASVFLFQFFYHSSPIKVFLTYISLSHRNSLKTFWPIKVLWQLEYSPAFQMRCEESTPTHDSCCHDNHTNVIPSEDPIFSPGVAFYSLLPQSQHLQSRSRIAWLLTV